ncbi:sodium:solute symporter family protein [Marinilongibacter aquaticus]|uniref:sodium:solute symporter family protein n=1 Tax=Marinilongibacter aquaticus TaxID=2975157 RepID=UPI0021BD19C1|nr:sodium:solute symporter family protein [Marinilongibacter aquaticus]UBM58961.1 sodium:solute symporter family protein [Marinilongibacter aquaticus]
MTTWIAVFFLIFFGLLVWASVKSYSKNRSSDEFMLAGSSIGAFLGFLTFAAALFSAFTFMGMPDFFRNHGVGAWLFLAFSDGFMVFFILWFAYKLRAKAKLVGYKGISGMVATVFGNRLAGYLVFINAFVFLVPYVAIQIRGISIFLEASFPGMLPSWGWALGLVVIMLVYAQIGGLKAIVFSDAIQALILLVVIWIIGTVCLSKAGGLEGMFASLEAQNPELLSLPGPNGLFTKQFLIASLISIILIPVSQPQFTTRLVVMKDLKAVHKMAYAVGFFAILVILPTAFIGFYGALQYPEANTSDFLTSALLHDQAAPVAALAVVGLFAACLSTTNAQIFALGTEIRSLLRGEDKVVMNKTRYSLLAFTVIVLVFSTIMGNELALLAKVSFTGTSMISPIIFGAIVFKKPPKTLIYTSALAFFIFFLSVVGLIPSAFGTWRLDIILYIFLTLSSILIFSTHHENKQQS